MPIEVKVLIQIEGKEPHQENIEVTTIEKAEEEVRAIVDNFNNTLRPHGKPRKFVRLIEGSELLHDWNRINLMVLEDGKGRLYDNWVCKNCGLKEKTYSIDALNYIRGKCYPDRTCEICQKVFLSKKNLEKHNIRIHNTDVGGKQ